MPFFKIFLLVIIILLIVIVISNIKIVPQAHAYKSEAKRS